jgi:hypothetical protein
MATITCAISSLTYTVQYCPAIISHTHNLTHPIFSLPQKELITLSRNNNFNSPVDSYLLFLSLLNSTSLVTFKLPCSYTQATEALVAKYMEPLVTTIIKLNAITHKQFKPPHIVINKDNSSLDCIGSYISSWKECIEDYNNSYRRANVRETTKRREEAVTILIKRDSPNMISRLADWASKAGEFPLGNTLVAGKQVPLSDYWKTLIKQAFDPKLAANIDKLDLADLIEHCEEYIPHGTVSANKLMAVLRVAKQASNDFFGLGEVSPSKALFTLAEDDLTTEDKNRLAMIHSAPTKLPMPEDYPNKAAYLIAKLKYSTAKRHYQEVARVEAQEAKQATRKTQSNSGSNTKLGQVNLEDI